MHTYKQKLITLANAKQGIKEMQAEKAATLPPNRRTHAIT